MPRKKGKKKINSTDFTINDCANAPKPVSRVKKSAIPEAVPVKSWEDLDDDDYDVVEEINPDGSKNVTYVKKQKHSKNNDEDITDTPMVVYPEIVWYLISPYIKPEDIGTFARINKATYAITKRESFWRQLYFRYCKNHPRLPDNLRIENSYKLYGLRQRVIRALYYTYKMFYKRAMESVDSSPHVLVRRRCLNVWYCKARTNWNVFFKLKKPSMDHQRVSVDKIDFIEELSRIDANPDEDCQVLQVTCQSLNEVPPLMGMALTSVNVSLAQGFIHQRVHLGFSTSLYNVSRHIVPDRSIIIDTVISMAVYDWWHPRYPHTDEGLPSIMKDEELLPVLKKDFFKFV